MTIRTLASLSAALLLLAPSLRGDEPAGVPAGHSAHGEAFDEGPRQKAYLMGGTGKVNLSVTTRSPEAQAFFNQGVGQLHGFWYFEAERSFRQAAALDPSCAMAYWGMALANVNNPKRARGFIQKAVALEGGASRRERLWIDAYAAYWQASKEEKERREDLVRSLEDLGDEFPAELEARAFLAFQVWDNSSKGVPIASRKAVDSLMKDVLAVEPMHPVHHYRIHLWDGDRARRALDSAALCGQSSPEIAHMWHMSGHIYSRLHRYADAAWQQEASARVDHRHMMHDGVLPDQIHNYAHNNQWLVEDLEYAGRAHDALALAKNMIELPRHPRYNTLGLKPDGSPCDHNHGSAGEGRRRLVEILTHYELWDETIALCGTMYLEPTDIPAEQVHRLRALGLGHFGKGDVERGRQQIQALEAMLHQVQADQQAAADRAEAKGRQHKRSPGETARLRTEAGKKFADRLPPIEAALAELRGHEALARGDRAAAGKLFEQAGDVPKDRLARLWLAAGDPGRAEKLAREAAAEGEGQVVPQAALVDVLCRSGKKAEAEEAFKRLRALSAGIDLDVPVMQRLTPLVHDLGLPADWRAPASVPPDVGKRPALASLGPIHWQPSPAPEWSLPGVDGRPVALHDYRGRPVVVIFFLGSGCPHCMEQLRTFDPLARQFADAGISLVAVSTDPPEGLKETFSKGRLSPAFTLAADPGLKVFKTYRAFDDFESVPLHATFLIDGAGRVRWQDVSYEPFRDPAFLLAESRRLLSLPEHSATARR